MVLPRLASPSGSPAQKEHRHECSGEVGLGFLPSLRFLLVSFLLMLASPPAEQTQGHQGCQKQQNPDTQQHGLKANEQGLGTEDRSCRHPSHCCHLRSVSMLIFNAGSLSIFSSPSLQLLRVGAAAEGALCVGSMGLACREHPETSLSLCDRLGL